jgi:Arc/MetJ family transcription regulator
MGYMPKQRLKVNLGSLDADLRQYATVRNISLNAAVCLAVADYLGKAKPHPQASPASRTS